MIESHNTKKKHVLEPKRLQNITILSKAVNATADQVCEQLEALAKMTPTKEEEAKLTGYKGDLTELSSAEHFVKRILNVPLAFHRIESMLYKETFNDEALLLQKSFSMLQVISTNLQNIFSKINNDESFCFFWM